MPVSWVVAEDGDLEEEWVVVRDEMVDAGDATGDVEIVMVDEEVAGEINSRAAVLVEIVKPPVQ
jgi:hypothetical protein